MGPTFPSSVFGSSVVRDAIAYSWGAEGEEGNWNTPPIFREDNPHLHVLLRRLLSFQVTGFCIAAFEGKAVLLYTGCSAV